MTKSELIEKMAQRLDITKKEAEKVVNTLLEAIIDAIKREEKVEFRGFGCFRVKRKKARIGRNPRTGEEINVPPKRVAYFKAGKELREAINRK